MSWFGVSSIVVKEVEKNWMDFDLWFGISVFEMDYIEFIGDRDSLWDDHVTFQNGLLLLLLETETVSGMIQDCFKLDYYY